MKFTNMSGQQHDYSQLYMNMEKKLHVVVKPNYRDLKTNRALDSTDGIVLKFRRVGNDVFNEKTSFKLTVAQSGGGPVWLDSIQMEFPERPPYQFPIRGTLHDVSGPVDFDLEEGTITVEDVEDEYWYEHAI